MIWSSGLDLGQAQDFSALAILQVSGTDVKYDIPGGTQILECLPLTHVHCRHLERFPLMTRYTDIVQTVQSRLKRLKGQSFLAVDKTGVGAGPFELLEAARLNPIGITITGGDKAQQGAHVRDQRVPKRDLVGSVQVALQNRILKFDRIPFEATLKKEIQNFRVKISAEGHDTYNNWRESDHDDLLLAVAIACWTAEQMIALFAKLGVDAIHDRIQSQRGGFGGEGSISPI